MTVGGGPSSHNHAGRSSLTARHVGTVASATLNVPVQRAPFASTRRKGHLFTRWIEAEVSTIAAHRAEPQRVRRGVAGFAAVLLARAVHLAGARLRQGRAAGARPRKGRRVPRAGIWDPHLARCCPGSATAGPYWLAEPVPAALALIASALSQTAMALFLAGTIAVEAGVSAACSGGGRPAMLKSGGAEAAARSGAGRPSVLREG